MSAADRDYWKKPEPSSERLLPDWPLTYWLMGALVVCYALQAINSVHGYPAYELNLALTTVGIRNFWAWQLLGQPGYEGHPLRAHEPSHARTPFTRAHYDRWIELFCDTVDESFAGPRAEVAKMRGRKMARAMERLLSGVSDDGGAPTEPVWRRPAR